MKHKFDEQYYKSNNYVDYLSKKERYVKTAEEIYHTFHKFGIINQNSTILDYGCSLGFLIKGFEQHGFNNVFGYDISEWATAQAKSLDCKIIDNVEGIYDLGIFLDVLEHMEDDEIVEVFKNVKFNYVLVRIPCAVFSAPGQFYLDISRKDLTHINCKTDFDWINFFSDLGYKKYFRINMSTIYDSDGCFCCLFI